VVAEHNDANELRRRAEALARAGRCAEAIPVMEDAIALFVDRDGEHDRNVLDGLRELGALYVDVGNYMGAQAVYERYLAVCEGACTPDDPRLGGAHHCLAELYRATRDYRSARLHAERCVAVWEKAYRKNSRDEIYVASALNNLASIEAKLDELPRAAELYRRAVEIEERIGGSVNPGLGTVLNNYANVLIAQKAYDRAGVMLERALAIVEMAYGADHADASLVLHSMGHLAMSKRDFETAETYLRRAVAIEDKLQGREAPTKAALLGYLGEVLRGRGRNAEAETFLRRALAIYERAYGEEHPKVQQMRDALGRIVPSNPPGGPS